jgi:hypothetical protein
MSNQTPTPWQVKDCENSNYTIEIVGTDNRGNEELVCRPSGRKIRDANAAFIVRAVNSHNTLVKALQDARAFMADRMHQDGNCGVAILIKAADAALALAKGAK